MLVFALLVGAWVARQKVAENYGVIVSFKNEDEARENAGTVWLALLFMILYSVAFLASMYYAGFFFFTGF